MPLPYVPDQKEVLWCDFAGLVLPEMQKRRPVVVVSPKFLGRAHLFTVVPLSTTGPNWVEKHHYEMTDKPVPTPLPVWAKADMLMTVSRTRLGGIYFGRAHGKRNYQVVNVSDIDWIGIQKAVLRALGLTHLTPYL